MGLIHADFYLASHDGPYRLSSVGSDLQYTGTLSTSNYAVLIPNTVSSYAHLNKVGSSLVGLVSRGARFNSSTLRSLKAKTRARREASEPGYAAQPAHDAHECNSI